MKMKPTCPKCFGEDGLTVVMEQQNKVFHCPRNALHKFTLDKNGFFVKHTP